MFITISPLLTGSVGYTQPAMIAVATKIQPPAPPRRNKDVAPAARCSMAQRAVRCPWGLAWCVGARCWLFNLRWCERSHQQSEKGFVV